MCFGLLSGCHISGDTMLAAVTPAHGTFHAEQLGVFVHSGKYWQLVGSKWLPTIPDLPSNASPYFMATFVGDYYLLRSYPVLWNVRTSEQFALKSSQQLVSNAQGPSFVGYQLLDAFQTSNGLQLLFRSNGQIWLTELDPVTGRLDRTRRIQDLDMSTITTISILDKDRLFAMSIDKDAGLIITVE